MSRPKVSTTSYVALLVIATILPMFSSVAWAQSHYKSLFNFSGGTDGSTPYAGLTFDSAGNLYGTTINGGKQGLGTVVKLAPGLGGHWKEQVLHNFAAYEGDGVNPYGSLTFDAAGNLYGTTVAGGAYSAGSGFRLTPEAGGGWRETVIYSFGGGGQYPMAGLTLDAAGNLYGTTSSGGTYPCSNNDCGVVFELTPDPKHSGRWTENVLYIFCAVTKCVDGEKPIGGVIFDAEGNLYGTTASGGTDGYGTVFKLRPPPFGKWLENVIHSFKGGNDGAMPSASLVFDAAGNLYGTAAQGGVRCGCGIVFELLPRPHQWREKVLHHFAGFSDGSSPLGGVVLDQSGNVFGTTSEGGHGGWGTIFELMPDSNGGWNETVLHAFFDQGGASPRSGLIWDAQGNLYGTSYGAQYPTFGSVFEITP